MFVNLNIYIQFIELLMSVSSMQTSSSCRRVVLEENVDEEYDAELDNRTDYNTGIELSDVKSVANPDADLIYQKMRDVEEEYYKRVTYANTTIKIFDMIVWICMKSYYILAMFSLCALSMMEFIIQMNKTTNLKKSVLYTSNTMFFVCFIFGICELIRINSLSYVVHRRYFSRVIFMHNNDLGITPLLGVVYLAIMIGSLTALDGIKDDCINHRQDCNKMWSLWFYIHFGEERVINNRTLSVGD